MFSALHWDFLHRAGLVAAFPSVLGVAAGVGRDDEQLRRDLLDAGVIVESAGGIALEASRRPVLEAFTAPAVKLFGTTLLYRDAVRRTVDPEVPEQWRELADATALMVPQSKFLVAVTNEVVASAVQLGGSVDLSGVDCRHADPVVQGARLLWEALAPGAPHETLPEVTVPMQAVAATAKARVDVSDPELAQQASASASASFAAAGVGADRARVLVDLLGQAPLAAAQVCVSVWDDHRTAVSTDAAIGLMQFELGGVLSVPSWRLDGSCHVTHMPATAARWEKEIVEFVARYRDRAKIA